MDEIVKLLWKRDEQALKIMESQYSGFCRSIVKRFLTNAQDAEEALNDIWFQIWKAIPPARPSNFKAYLAKAARNTALHHIEYNNAQKRSAISESIEELSECIPDKYVSVNVESYHIREILNRFVRSLRHNERSFFVRRYYFGECIREIARQHDVSENTVTVTLSRTRSKLRTLLEKEEIPV